LDIKDFLETPDFFIAAVQQIKDICHQDRNANVDVGTKVVSEISVNSSWLDKLAQSQ
jgi:hypothetical protein